MAKLTKAKARKRLLEAKAKFKKVYIDDQLVFSVTGATDVVSTKDMEAVEKIVARCLKRIQ